MDQATFRRKYQPGVTTFNAKYAEGFEARLDAERQVVRLFDKITGADVGEVGFDPMNDDTSAIRFVVTSKKLGMSFESIPNALRAIMGGIASNENRRKGVGRTPEPMVPLTATVAAQALRRTASPLQAKLLAGAATLVRYG